MQFFDTADAVMFVSSLTFYRENLSRHESPDCVNALTDSLECFKEINSSKILNHSLTVLILSKFDLLAKAMKSHPVVEYLPEYKGLLSEDVTDEVKRQFCKLIVQKFKDVLPKNRELSVQIASCNNTKAISSILADTFNRIIVTAMKNSGIF
jgi:hypothetical protein